MRPVLVVNRPRVCTHKPRVCLRPPDLWRPGPPPPEVVRPVTRPACAEPRLRFGEGRRLWVAGRRADGVALMTRSGHLFAYAVLRGWAENQWFPYPTFRAQTRSCDHRDGASRASRHGPSRWTKWTSTPPSALGWIKPMRARRDPGRPAASITRWPAACREASAPSMLAVFKAI